jgi:predicted RecA/RadA family phage recombinase
MAKAIPRGGLRQLETLKHSHTSAVEAHDVIVVNGNVLVAVNPAVINEENVYIFRGPVSFPKPTNAAMGAVTKIYWDASSGKASLSSSGTTLMGVSKKAAATSDPHVLVELMEN